jgi:hypothetical protein
MTTELLQHQPGSCPAVTMIMKDIALMMSAVHLSSLLLRQEEDITLLILLSVLFVGTFIFSPFSCC